MYDALHENVASQVHEQATFVNASCVQMLYMFL